MAKQRTYFCIDMKTFYASVECAERGYNPFETNLVVADLTRGKNALCLAITPKMKAQGIKNRCRLSEIPNSVKYEVAPPRMALYIEYAADIYSLYLDYFDPQDIHVYSIDEAFIDVTDYLAPNKMDAVTFAKFLMNEIANRYHIPSTAGIGTNLYLAKIALDITAKHARDHKKVATLNVAETTKEEMSELMVGRKVSFTVDKGEQQLGETVLDVKNLVMRSRTSQKNIVDDISFSVRRGEIVCIAGIDGNGQSETIYGLTGIMPIQSGTITLNGKDITKADVRTRNLSGISHIPEDRHKYGLILDFSLKENLILKSYFKPSVQRHAFINWDKAETYSEELIEKYDIRTTLGAKTSARSMSGGNQQKAIIAREIEENSDLLIAVQPTRGLDVGAIEFVHKQLIAQRDAGKAVLMMSLELDEVMDVSDRVLVMFEGKIVADVDPKKTTIQQMGLYMAGVKKEEQHA